MRRRFRRLLSDRPSHRLPRGRLVLGPLFLSVTLTLLVFSLLSCNDEATRPGQGDCWMGVDTLLATGIAISDTTDVHLAFDRFVACADSGGCRAFGPEGSAWNPMRYRSSVYHWTWEGDSRRYWSVTHWELKPECGGWIPQRYIYVDENGTVVLPLGCI